MLNPDRWADTCPEAEDCTKAELIDFLQVWPHARLTDWEVTFCQSALRILRWGRLNQRQMNVLDRGLLLRLWNNDPQLWV